MMTSEFISYVQSCALNSNVTSADFNIGFYIAIWE